MCGKHHIATIPSFASLRADQHGLIGPANLKGGVQSTCFDDVVKESLLGIEAAHGDLLTVHIDPHYIVRTDAPVPGKVGRGMLDAACPGEVFTSSSPDQMLEATKAVNSSASVLHIVKNYTGDVMNFEMAAELAQAEGR